MPKTMNARVRHQIQTEGYQPSGAHIAVLPEEVAEAERDYTERPKVPSHRRKFVLPGRFDATQDFANRGYLTPGWTDKAQMLRSKELE